MFLRSVGMTDSVMLDRVAARRAEWISAEAELVKRLAEVRGHRGGMGHGRTGGHTRRTPSDLAGGVLLPA